MEKQDIEALCEVLETVSKGLAKAERDIQACKDLLERLRETLEKMK